MHFKGDIIITDPCYIIPDNSEDWSRCYYGENMETLGFTTFISESTIYGDWSCTTFETDTDPRETVDRFAEMLYSTEEEDRTLEIEKSDETAGEIGEFCADAGMVGVFLLDEVKKYNPDFDWYDSRPWTTTLIPGFDGEIDYYIDKFGDAHIIGKGNINFFTTQTGL